MKNKNPKAFYLQNLNTAQKRYTTTEIEQELFTASLSTQLVTDFSLATGSEEGFVDHMSV
jgi:hypothetical protein